MESRDRSFAASVRTIINAGWRHAESESFLLHLRNEPGHNRNEDDGQGCDDQHDSSWRDAVRFGLAGLRQGFGQAVFLDFEAQDARAPILFRRFGRGCGSRLLSESGCPAFDRPDGLPPSACSIISACSASPFQSHSFPRVPHVPRIPRLRNLRLFRVFRNFRLFRVPAFSVISACSAFSVISACSAFPRFP